jgi:hypothetical protein
MEASSNRTSLSADLAVGTRHSLQNDRIIEQCFNNMETVSNLLAKRRQKDAHQRLLEFSSVNFHVPEYYALYFTRDDVLCGARVNFSIRGQRRGWYGAPFL